MSLFSKIFGTGNVAPAPRDPKRISLKKRTHVYLLLDESGSMESARTATIDGFNRYLRDLRKDEGDEVLFTFVKFSGMIGTQKVYVQADPNEAPLLNKASYTPNGGTPLLDAIGEIVTYTESTINRSDKVIFVIMTDGEENTSRNFNRKQIKDLIERKQDAGWQFVFLGADIDAYKVGRDYGFSDSSIAQYSKDRSEATMSVMGSATAAMRSSYVRGHDTSGPLLSAEAKIKIEKPQS